VYFLFQIWYNIIEVKNMSEDIKNLSIEQLASKADELSIEGCKYCRYKSECSGGVHPDGGGNPIYPPCADGDFDTYVDEDELLRLVEEGLNCNEGE
jgi:hypothetical protein